MDPQILRRMTQQSVKYHNKVLLNVELEEEGLTDADSILQKEKERLGIKNPRITLEQLGFGAIQKGDNLYKLVRDKKVQILNFESDSHRTIKMILKADQRQTFSLQAGTLLLPTDERCATTQSLVISQDLTREIFEGQTAITIQTFCFNSELRSPNVEHYLLGSIKSSLYTVGMSQCEVWEITLRQKVVLKKLEEKYEREDYVAFTTSQVSSILAMWNQIERQR